MPTTPVTPDAPAGGPGPDVAPEPARRQPPRVVTVLAAVGALAALVAVLAVVTPSVRDQVALTLGRQDAPYVETWFADPLAARSCNPGSPRYAADVTVGSHLDRATDVPFELRLVPVRGGRTVVERGSVTVFPDRETTVPIAARKPRGGFRAEVVFPGRDQMLRVHCTGVRR